VFHPLCAFVDHGPANTSDLLGRIPPDVSTEAYDAVDQIRDGAWVAEPTHLIDLSCWPTSPPAERHTPVPTAHRNSMNSGVATTTRIREPDSGPSDAYRDRSTDRSHLTTDPG